MSAPFDLHAFADAAMREHGFIPDVPAAVAAEADALQGPREPAGVAVRDLRALAWSSIDNDSSRDLDQLEVVEPLGDGTVRLRVAIADVATTVPAGSETDRFAAANATSVYTGVVTFPMLPERLSTDLTSLGQDADRPAMVIECTVGPDGETRAHTVYLAHVVNHAKLAYGSVGAWLDGHGTLPEAATPAIQAQLRQQDEVARWLRAARGRAGALALETVEVQPVVRADRSVDVQVVQRTRASLLIEDFMIAANVAIARFLDAHGSPSIRRIVREPRRWSRIVALAAGYGATLPAEPSSAALEAFLVTRRAADPARFAELSLAVVKLIGPGEYALHVPGAPDVGHFGLATHDYAHATAPNRRYGDLVTQRLVLAVLGGAPVPYGDDELARIAAHCTAREDAARAVERVVRKAAAAVAMQGRVGETFTAIVSGVTPRGTFVHLLHPPVEGRVMRGEGGLDVGDRVRVRLLGTDPARGFVDFAAEGTEGRAGGSTPG